jgi:hypothetical protein
VWNVSSASMSICIHLAGAAVTVCICRLPVAAGDWLQGPYVYHLYEYYGFSVRDIGRLFIMGFGSSAVFGTLAGAMADYRCA